MMDDESLLSVSHTQRPSSSWAMLLLLPTMITIFYTCSSSSYTGQHKPAFSLRIFFLYRCDPCVFKNKATAAAAADDEATV
jgi:hypothetical protein